MAHCYELCRFDAVYNNGSSYICISAHTSGGTTEPGVGASWTTKWAVIARRGTLVRTAQMAQPEPQAPQVRTAQTVRTATDGADGADGAPGSVWYSGAGTPSGGTGIDGDFYLNTTNDDVYVKVSGSWGVIANIKGATGATGAAGAANAHVMQIKVIEDAATLATGDGQVIVVVPPDLNGLEFKAANAYVTTVSSSGLPTVQIRNVTDAVDMLTTKITIDASEFTSYTAATAPVIDTAHDDVATGDLLAIDVDVAGTGAKGLGVVLTFA